MNTKNRTRQGQVLKMTNKPKLEVSDEQIQKLKDLFVAVESVGTLFDRAGKDKDVEYERGEMEYAQVLWMACLSARQIFDELDGLSGEHRPLKEALEALHDIIDGVVKLSQHSDLLCVQEVTPLFRLVREETARMMATA